MSKLVKLLSILASLGGGAAIIGYGIYYSSQGSLVIPIDTEEIYEFNTWKPLVDISEFGVFTNDQESVNKNWKKIGKQFGVYLVKTNEDKEIWDKSYERLNEAKNDVSKNLNSKFSSVSKAFSETEEAALNKVCESFHSKDFETTFYKKPEQTTGIDEKTELKGFQKTLFNNFWQYCTFIEEAVEITTEKTWGVIADEFRFYLPEASPGRNAKLWKFKTQLYELRKGSISSEVTEITNYWNN